MNGELKGLVRDTANELDQLFRQKHKIAEVEHCLRRFASAISRASEQSSAEFRQKHKRIEELKTWIEREHPHNYIDAHYSLGEIRNALLRQQPAGEQNAAPQSHTPSSGESSLEIQPNSAGSQPGVNAPAGAAPASVPEGMKGFVDVVEALAFEMPAPNPYTPRFVQFCVEARAALAARKGRRRT